MNRKDESRSADEIILEGWRETEKNYKPGELYPAEKAAFVRMKAADEVSRFKGFVLPL